MGTINKPKLAFLEKTRKWPMFVIVYTDGSRKKFTKHLTWPEAEKKLSEIRNRIELGSFDLADYTQVRVRSEQMGRAGVEYLNERDIAVKLDNKSRKTVTKDKDAILLFIQFKSKTTMLAQIGRKELDEFVLWLREGTNTRYGKPYANASIRTYLKALSTFFSWCVDKKYMPVNPIIGYFKTAPRLAKDETPKYATEEDVDVLRAELAKGPAWWSDAVNFGLWVGARASEILGVRKTDIYKRVHKDKVVTVVRLFGKGKKERFVPVGPECDKLIKRRLEWLDSEQQLNEIIYHAKSPRNREMYKQRWREGYLFFEVVDPRSPGQAVRIARIRTGITRKVKFHTTRHTYATELLGQGIPIAAVSKLLGHSEIRTTEIYAKIVDDALLTQMENAKEI